MSRCVETVHRDWSSRRCPNPAKHGDYCGVHSPEKKAERKRKRGPTEFERRIVQLRARDHTLQELLIAARRTAEDRDDHALRAAIKAFEKVRWV